MDWIAWEIAVDRETLMLCLDLAYIILILWTHGRIVDSLLKQHAKSAINPLNLNIIVQFESFRSLMSQMNFKVN